MFLTHISLKRPVFATVIIIALLAVGLISYKNLPVEQYPGMDIPFVMVTISQNGAAPDQLESKVTKKVEDAVGQISGVKHVTSTILQGISDTQIEFQLEKPSSQALQEVKDKISSIRGELPTTINEPVIMKFEMNSEPIISLAVASDMPNLQLSEVVQNDIVKKLNTIKGIGTINVFGDQKREIHVKLNKEKMAALNIAPSEISDGLGADNINMSSGKVSNKDSSIALMTNATIKNIDDFLNVLVAKRNGSEIRLRDVAEIEDSIKEKEDLSYYNGKQTIGVDIIKQSGANTVQLAGDVKKELANIQKSLPQGVKIEMIRDNSIPIIESMQDVIKTIVEGCVLAVIIVFIFLRSVGSTAISALSLPIALIATFTAMKVMKFSLNTMTLMALSLAVGLLIDDAIVVIENIARHLKMGKTPLKAAMDGTNEIGLAVMATTLAVVAVFVPIAMINGTVGQYIKEFGITVAASVLVSLFVSFTLVPLLSAKYLKDEENKKIPIISIFLDGFNKLFDKIANLYAKSLKVTLKHRIIMLVIPIALFFGSIMLIKQLDINFMSASDEAEITVEAEFDAGSTLNNAEKITKRMEGILKKHPEVKFLYTTIKPEKTSIMVKTTGKLEREKSISTIGEEIRESLKNIPGMNVSVFAGSAMSGGKAIQYHFKGQDFAELQEYVLKAKKVLGQVPGVVDVSTSDKTGQQQVKLDVDRDKVADLGVSPVVVSNTLDMLFNGTVVTKYETEKDKYDVRMQLKEDERKDFDSLQGIYVPGSNGNMIPIEQVVKKVFATDSTNINRYDKSREILLSANLVGTSLVEFSNTFEQKLKSEAPMPKSVSISSGGSEESMGESFGSLAVALGMGILFIFLVLAAQFESFVDPLAILFSLPLAIIGAIVGLYVGHKELNMMSAIGIIMLMGLVTKNAILLIDCAKQKHTEGQNMKEALAEAGHTRLRPIMMTTLAMIFGMIPTAIATGSGAEMRAPMAYAIIGGLITSTILTLYVVPVIYTLLNDFKSFFRKRSTDNTINEAEVA